MDEQEAREAVVTATEARHEIEDHGADWEQFVFDQGLHTHYTGVTVFNWLGY